MLLVRLFKSSSSPHLLVAVSRDYASLPCVSGWWKEWTSQLSSSTLLLLATHCGSSTFPPLWNVVWAASCRSRTRSARSSPRWGGTSRYSHSLVSRSLTWMWLHSLLLSLVVSRCVTCSVWVTWTQTSWPLSLRKPCQSSAQSVSSSKTL